MEEAVAIHSGADGLTCTARWSVVTFSRLGRCLPLLIGVSLACGACGGGDGGGGPDDGADGDGADGDGDDDDNVADSGGDGGDDGTSPDGGPGFEQVPLIEGLTTLAGAGISGARDGGRTTALFSNPVNVVVTGNDELIVADFDNGLIRRVTAAGDVTTISEPPAGAVFVRPFGLALEGDVLYVQTDGNSLGQPGPPGGALWRMPAGGGVPELVRDNIGRCRGIAPLRDGRLVLSDHRSHHVRLFDPASGSMTALAGAPDAPGFADGQGIAAQFDQPYGVVAGPFAPGGRHGHR